MNETERERKGWVKNECWKIGRAFLIRSESIKEWELGRMIQDSHPKASHPVAPGNQERSLLGRRAQAPSSLVTSRDDCETRQEAQASCVNKGWTYFGKSL